MLKIAIPTRNGNIDDHFGHCESYTIISVDDGNNIISTDKLPSPQGCGCKSNIAEVLKENGVTVMLAGSMGAGALNKLNSNNITVYRGCNGDVMECAKKYLAGQITDSGESCAAHENGDHQCQHHGNTEYRIMGV